MSTVASPLPDPSEAVTLLAVRLLERDYESIPAHERRIIERVARRLAVSQDVNVLRDSELTFGERLADRVARFGGSWSFIALFAAAVLAWMLGNTLLTARPFDPFPFILLNLFLSLVAAIQAPIIMMSQNRQAAKDRVQATHDYEVNLKAEIEIMALHEKLDELRNRELAELISNQKTSTG